MGPWYPSCMSSSEPRDLMAPDTEPTDEELALVMRAARDRAMARRAIADAWIAARLVEAAQYAREHGLPGKHDKPGGA
jgi:hypothetical protein